MVLPQACVSSGQAPLADRLDATCATGNTLSYIGVRAGSCPGVHSCYSGWGGTPVRQESAMKQLAAVALVAVIAACSNASGPQGGYTGTWKGTLPFGDTVVTITTQHDSMVSGIGAITSNTNSKTAFTVTGTSFRPNLSLLLHFGDSVALPYSGTYVTADSVAGFVLLAPSVGSPPLSLKRQ
jgi:hypothetical protein